MTDKLKFTEEQLDYIALCIIQAVHIYSMQGNTIKEQSDNCNSAMQELLRDSGIHCYDPIHEQIMSRIERVGKANGYWKDDLTEDFYNTVSGSGG